MLNQLVHLLHHLPSFTHDQLFVLLLDALSMIKDTSAKTVTKDEQDQTAVIKDENNQPETSSEQSTKDSGCEVIKDEFNVKRASSDEYVVVEKQDIAEAAEAREDNAEDTNRTDSDSIENCDKDKNLDLDLEVTMILKKLCADLPEEEMREAFAKKVQQMT